MNPLEHLVAALLQPILALAHPKAPLSVTSPARSCSWPDTFCGCAGCAAAAASPAAPQLSIRSGAAD